MHQLEQYKEALKDADSSLALWPSYTKALQARGRIHVLQEDYDAAIEDFERILELSDSISMIERAKLEDELRDAQERAAAEHNTLVNYYVVLGEPLNTFQFRGLHANQDLPKNCTSQDVKRAYRKKSLIHHPDKVWSFLIPYTHMSHAYRDLGQGRPQA